MMQGRVVAGVYVRHMVLDMSSKSVRELDDCE